MWKGEGEGQKKGKTSVSKRKITFVVTLDVKGPVVRSRLPDDGCLGSELQPDPLESQRNFKVSTPDCATECGH